jgi:outer membrane protein OmpA-like peptidoglycan-associated protein
MMRALLSLVLAGPLLMAQGEVPTFKVDVVSKTVNAVNYKAQGGSTKIDFEGTSLMPGASGEAKVESRQAVTSIEAKFQGLTPPWNLGAEYLTYVLWAISPEGKVLNLGEVLIDKNGKAELKTTSEMPVFGLIVTAEPYFSVTRPTDLIVAQNELRKKTEGRRFVVEAKAELLKKGEYAKLGNPLGLTPDLKAQPLEMYEARNAISIATNFKADKYANDTLDRAKSSLKMAENALAAKKDRKDVITLAREAVQFAEEARLRSVAMQEDEFIARTKKRAADEAKARADADAARKAEEARRAAAEAAKVQAEKERLEAERAKLEAERARLQAEQAKAQAEAQAARDAAARSAAQAAQAQAIEEQRKAKEAAEAAQREKQELRRRLLDQFNAILETKDSDRGLVVNIGDVLFDIGKATLKQDAQLKLARFAGIVLNYPGLNLASEGHTDNTGSAEFNQKLSEQRAAAVRDFLVGQGVAADRITSVGRSFNQPIADNSTAAGRRQNRRVEIIVSGEVIGEKIGQ